MSSRLQSLTRRKEEFESQIAHLEKLSNDCNQQLKGESDLDKRSQLNLKIENYGEEIDELYDKLDDIEEKMRRIKSSSQKSPLNNHLDNPKHLQELELDKSLRYIDFKKALEIFEKIQSQFDQAGDVALFFMEESLIKRGDLWLNRLRDDFELNVNRFYRQSFRHCTVEYTAGNLDSVVRGIANHFNIKQEKTELAEYIGVILQQIAGSLQNNSFLFMEIHCDINDAIDIDPLIPWFIDDIWQPLRAKVQELAEDYEGIRVVAVISSKLTIEERLLTDDLSCYQNNNCDLFLRDKLVKIPLENWSQDDISTWLKYVKPGLRKSEINKISSKVYNATKGQPTAVCCLLQQEWQKLIHLPTSC